MAASAGWLPPRISSRDAGMSGKDITIYEAGDHLGGAFSLAGAAATGYIVPTGAVFDAEFRFTFDLLATIPSASRSRRAHPARAAFWHQHARPARLCLVRLALTPEAKLDGRRIDEFFRADFFATILAALDHNHGAAAAAQCDGDAARFLLYPGRGGATRAVVADSFLGCVVSAGSPPSFGDLQPHLAVANAATVVHGHSQE